MIERYKVVHKEKQGNRNIYGVLDTEKGRVAQLTTQELGLLCEKGLVEGYGGNSKRVYKLAPKEVKNKPLKQLFRGDKLNYKVIKYYQKYITGVKVEKEIEKRIIECIRHNEEVRPEGEYRSATLYEPRETPTVDVDTLDDVTVVTLQVEIAEEEAYKDLRAKGYLVTKSDIAGINEGRQNDLYNFWYDIIESYMLNDKGAAYDLIETLYHAEQEGILKNVEFDIEKVHEGRIDYRTEPLQVDEERIVEEAFDKIGF